jgi:hypothetical protein
MIRTYGFVGLGIIILAEILLFLDVPPVPMFFTPIVWWGYILFTDSLVFKLRGGSLITSYPKTFLYMIPISIGCWLIFELYNVRLANWEYINMSDSFAIRVVGYILSFATITPGIYETAHLIQAKFFPEGLHWKKLRFSGTATAILMLTGALFMIVPLLVSKTASSYLFGLVWVGVIPLVDPISRKLGAPSLLAELEQGEWATFVSFLLSGVGCGLLWEFWNYWALTKWVYHVPFWNTVKYFEMPLIGFLGFLPFALECFVMFNLCAAILRLEHVRFPGNTK